MSRRTVIDRKLLALMWVAVIVCQLASATLHAAAMTTNRDQALQTLRRYLQLRTENADWKEYSKLITWPDEPSWDCHWVISKYDIRQPRKIREKVVAVPVVFDRLGLFCHDFEFRPESKVMTVNYELVNRRSGWKVNAPIPDYPDIGADALIRMLRNSAESERETPERRAQAEITARKITEALTRSSATSQ